MISPGDRFGSWTVISAAPRRGDHALWLCQCACGTTRDVWQTSLKRGKTNSCGCESTRRRNAKLCTHGKTYTAEYRIWASMIQRCTNPENTAYKSYGGRGIRVCERWRASFEDFINDVGTRPSRSHSLDRVNNDDDYRPGNCRWATPLEQMQNTSRTKWVRIGDDCLTLRQWSEKTGIPLRIIRRRLQRGWSNERALGQRVQVHTRRDPRIAQGPPRSVGRPPLDVTGHTYGKLTCVTFIGRSGNGHAIWRCRCACGNDRDAFLSGLRRGDTRSCGCSNIRRNKKPPDIIGVEPEQLLKERERAA